MTHFDVFNGDADGLCALHQWRLTYPADARLVTGRKREIALLARVDAHAGDVATVLDVSLDANRDALVRLLSAGVTVDYVDHHHAGAVPTHPLLHATIDTAPEVCTSLIVDRLLDGRHRAWAIVGAFGDNLDAPAERLAQSARYDAGRTERLRVLGEVLNYNAYGDSDADLVVHPALLYGILHRYDDPSEFAVAEPVVRLLADARCDDLSRAQRTRPRFTSSAGSVFVLPDAGWARRVRGAFANWIANAEPGEAHAVITPFVRGGCTVSVRAPLTQPRDADVLCRMFGGDGRTGAAGIEGLPDEQIERFAEQFERCFGASQ